MRVLNCEQCENPKTVPSGYITDLPYEADGITPNFDALFAALAEQERNAPPPEEPVPQ